MKETKNVPQLRFSGFDDEWEEKKLGDSICEVNERTSDFNKNPLFSLTIENGITEKTERYERSQLVTKDDDLFKIMHPQNFATNPMNLRFGAVGYSKEKQDISVSGYYDVFSIDNNECSDFWYSYFKTDKILKKFDDAATGSLIEKRRVHFSVLKQLVFLQPNYKEKQKIGAFLSHVDSLIQAKTKKLESLKAVKKSLLQKCFPKAGEKIPEMRFAGFSGDWKETRLDEIYACITNAFVGIASPYYCEKGHFYLESNNVKNGQINRNSQIFINDEFYTMQKNKWLKTNDLVMVQSGHVGHSAVITEDLNNSAAHALIMLKNAMNNTDPYFVNYQFQSVFFQKQIQNITKGNTIKHILSSDIKKCTIFLPLDKLEQQKIGQFFSKYDSLIGALQKEINKLKDIKKALLQKMFL